MPREEPVMTATFPDISNKVMRFSLILTRRRTRRLSFQFSDSRIQASLLAVAISGPAG
jgi:hypothetical protein